MRKVSVSLRVVGVVVAVCLHAAAAHAQASRTWVSGVGDDANPCSRTAPCKTFAGAISKTAPHGEINVLDPGGFGAVTITKPISIISASSEAGVLVSGTNGIVINLANANDTVVLEGLDFEGLGTGLDGVKIIGTGKTTIRRCSIRHFSGNGVNLVGTASARVFIVDSFLLNNGNGATGGGFNMQGASGSANTALIQNTLLDSNAAYSVQVTGASTLILSGSTLTGTGVSIGNGGGGAAIISYGNNLIRGAGLPTQTLPLQ